MRNNIYSVSQVNTYVKNMFLTDDWLQNLKVRGEVSNCTYHPSGHIYFTLKDEKGTISCVMFKGSRAGLKFNMREGMQVVVTGSCDVFESQGKYQIYARIIEQDGIGDLFERFERLKQELCERGMFAEEYKQPIPKFAHTLGVVTASQGAAVRDIIDVSKRRNPGISIILYPATVQGEGAPESIVRGIKALDAYGVDTIIVGRGGGSIEDLWAFNDERVAQAIFDCSTPIISAVGHEVDFTIADFVADLRAPTPSAAAEIAVCDVRETIIKIKQYRSRMERDMNHKLSTYRMLLETYKGRVNSQNPLRKIAEWKQSLCGYRQRLDSAMLFRQTEAKHRLEILIQRLEGLSPLSRLSGAFAYVEGPCGPVSSAGALSKDDAIELTFKDGNVTAKVTDTKISEQ